MNSVSWVRQLRDAGVVIEEGPVVAEYAASSGREIMACLLGGQRDGGNIFSLTIKPGLSELEKEKAAYEAIIRIDRFQEHGPEPDAWQGRSDGDFQIWLRAVELDPWLTDGFDK